jgi:hypothetical protein
MLLCSLEMLREQQTTLLGILAVESTSCAEIGIDLWGFYDFWNFWESWEFWSCPPEMAPNALCEWFIAVHGDVSILSGCLLMLADIC